MRFRRRKPPQEPSPVDVAFEEQDDVTARFEAFIAGGGDLLSEEGVALRREWKEKANAFIEAAGDEARRRGLT